MNIYDVLGYCTRVTKKMQVKRYSKFKFKKKPKKPPKTKTITYSKTPTLL